MWKSKNSSLAGFVALVGVAGLCGCTTDGGEPLRSASESSQVTVDGQVALNSLMALGDGHLQKMADMLGILAGTEAARSADWERIRGPLEEVARVNAPALVWFALPDGGYWSVDEGRAEASLSDRAYFPRVLAGERVMGDLVISHATGKSVAIVAVPVVRDEAVVGVLGASVYLDRLSDMINRQMHLAQDHLFYSLDAQPLVGLHKDPETIFFRPLEEGDPALSAAIRQIIEAEEGTVTYHFQGRQRTVLYRKSPVTGWWYAFGRMQR